MAPKYTHSLWLRARHLLRASAGRAAPSPSRRGVRSGAAAESGAESLPCGLVSIPRFRFVCVPAALEGSPAEWARELLVDGEIALQADAGGFDAINHVAHALDLVSVAVVRSESSPARQEEAVIAYAQSLPLIWVAGSFSERAGGWAHARGAMTLLVATSEPLSESERRRIERFVAALGRQSE